jgi:hypothetical protein
MLDWLYKNRLGLVIMFAIMFAILFLHGCCSSNDSGRLKESYYDMYVFVDPDTGVNYLVRYNYGITPRLNPDGSLYITK